MTLPSSFFLFLLPATLVFGQPHPTDRTPRWPQKGEPMEEGRRMDLAGNQDRLQKSVDSQGNPENMLKVLDFSADNDQQPDSNGEYTGATLEAGSLPESFTICSAIMVDAWTTKPSALIFVPLNNDGYLWGHVFLYAASSYTEYTVWLGPVSFTKQTETVFFPLQWTRVCLSVDSNKVMLVVDGQLLGEKDVLFY